MALRAAGGSRCFRVARLLSCSPPLAPSRSPSPNPINFFSSHACNAAAAGGRTALPRVVMLGAPGSGKGTYAKAIAGKLLRDQHRPDDAPSSSSSSASPLLRSGSNGARCLQIFSTGDMLRAEIAAGTDLGAKAKGYADRGHLVPDQVVIDAVLSRLDREAAEAATAAAGPAQARATELQTKLDDADSCYEEFSKKMLEMEMERYATPAERVNGEAAMLKMGAAARKAYAEAEALRQELLAMRCRHNQPSNLAESSDADSSFGFILDGFPRTTVQAAALEAYRGGIHAPTTVVNVQLDTDVIVAKLLGRRVCPECGTSYNVASVRDDVRGIDMPAMEPPAACAPKLEMRSDDTEAVIKARLAVYDEETAPLVEFYRKRGNLVDFVVKKGMKDVESLRKKIRKHEKLRVIAEAWATTTV